jgi:GT2 family glycosyltransferase
MSTAESTAVPGDPGAIRRIREAVRRHVPPDSTIIVATEGDGELLDLHGRRAWRFPQTQNNEHAGGQPANSTAAIVQMEFLRSRGADYFLLPSASLSWLDQVTEFREHLEHRYHLVFSDDHVCLLFALRESTDRRSEPWSRTLKKAIQTLQSHRDCDPTILDWNSGLELTRQVASTAVFEPVHDRACLPYLDKTIDIVAVPAGDETRLTEARRIAAGAVVIVAAKGDSNRHVDLDIEWQTNVERSWLPRTSIVIPSFNGIGFTEVCLATVEETLPAGLDCEIIVVDDGSTDDTSQRLRTLAGRCRRLKVLRNETNSGFIVACNRGASAATGEVLVFLNNDTVPLPGWLVPLLRLLRDRKDAGAVGGKLMYPDGRLQEAGDVIFRDGSGANFGRGDYNADDPLYSYAREVDYCSGALLATPRVLFRELGGFDDRFSPGYYEETDYCFRVRQKGHRVYYQPDSVVIHVEGGINGTDVADGKKRYQVINREKFIDKWADALRTQPEPPGRYNRDTWHALAVRGCG